MKGKTDRSDPEARPQAGINATMTGNKRSQALNVSNCKGMEATMKRQAKRDVSVDCLNKCRCVQQKGSRPYKYRPFMRL